VPSKLVLPLTPAKNKAKKGESISARIVKMPQPNADWKILNPKLKGFKDAKIADVQEHLPYNEQRMVTRGPVGGESGKGQSQF